MPVEDKSVITINLKWLHLLLGVIATVLTVMLTLGSVTNRYVDNRINDRMLEQEMALKSSLEALEKRQQERADARLMIESQERKDQIKLVREDLVYIREKVDLIALHLDGRDR